MKGLVVELCGLPGAGKSSLARDVVAGALALGADAPGVRMLTAAIGPEIPSTRRIARKLRLVTGETLRRPASAGGVGWNVARSGQGGVGPVASRWVQWEATQRLMAEARSAPGLHLFDEGVTQALWSLGIRGDPSATLDRLRRRAGRWDHPDLVAMLDLPIETVDARLSRRRSHHSRLQGTAEGALRRAELARGRELFERLLSWWAECLPADVWVIRMGDAATPSPHRASELLAAIDRLRASGAVAGPPERGGARLVQPT